ncbi:Bacteriophage HK97-gp10, putative tail-component [uncultured Caudovirales phage]|uniref:Bacteriophage HK97-gp10, putative tail-component n=1 Tax=uncultured Caudovirales phage TaxID=2100421 RepID=A0A6J5S2R0_9CAUD|nr:Bacteriophage HK97-gp10, putative tail-component [uncultured Caudovirales phage]CAB4199344.1 Bacteriophage HK97-gp10, putative tail-component [uncultured Caudovirales phage]CAB4212940.1 Bacteriophage HK97-gp10, putative tail-component [uncultured Caudovirales phage]CAB5227982.1 Bacteriophage HK97-gp10, putative tail-component [uncultured Caudovirales phage]
MAGCVIDGFDDFRRELAKLPAELQAEASPIVHDTAEEMAEDVRAGYAVGDTGNLWKGIRIQHEGPLASRVRTTAPHAHLYEFGTVTRRTKSSGANRGQMPGKPVFISAAIRARYRMIQRLDAEVMQKARPALGEGTLG